MRTIAFISRKGGTGKTTLAAAMAWSAARGGLRCVVADVDPQHGALEILGGQEANPVAVESSGGKLHTLKLGCARSRTDLLVIDTPAGLDANALQAIHAADFCVIVARPNYLDLSGAAMTGRTLKQLSKRALVVLNQAPSARRGMENRLVVRAMEALRFTGFPIAPTVVHTRLAFVYASTERRSVDALEPNGAAAREVASLWADVVAAAELDVSSASPAQR